MPSPTFSRSKFKMRKNVLQNDQNGEAYEYRGTAFLQFRTDYNEDTNQYQPMTAAQEKICEDLWRQLHDAGVQIGMTVAQRLPGETDVRKFPKVMSFSLVCNDPPERKEEPQEDHGNGW